MKAKVLILGGGKIGQALVYYLEKNRAISKVALFSDNGDILKKSIRSDRVEIITGKVSDEKKTRKIEDYDVLIGALPEESGKEGLKLALKYKKDLIDISAVPVSFYLQKKKEIRALGIRVVAGCGVSPGLANLIVGFEMKNFRKEDFVEIGAGTLPMGKKFLFPFTWSFRDLIEEHLYKASVLRDGMKINMPPFSGYEIGKLRGLGEFESYLVDEWSTIFYSLHLQNVSFRVIRPVGFFHFFQYLKNHGFFEKKNIALTEKILTEKTGDNVTALYVRMNRKGPQKRGVFWQISSFSKSSDRLNSMQKITSQVPVAVLNLLLEKKISKKGLIFMEDIGQNEESFSRVVGELKKIKISIKRETSKI